MFVHVDIKHSRKFIIHAFALNRSQTDLDGFYLAGFFVLNHVVGRFSTHGRNNMTGGLQHGIDQSVVHRRHIAPSRKVIAFTGAFAFVHLFQEATSASPGVREAINDNNAVAVGFGKFNSVAILFRRKGRLDFTDIKTAQVGVK